MITINQLLWGSQKLTVAVAHLPKCLFSTDMTKFARYSESFVDPNPDRKMYRQGPPQLSDDIASKLVKAAPTSQTYSNFYDKELYKFEKMLVKKGNSATARKIVRGTLEYIKIDRVTKYHKASPEERDLIELNPVVIFHQALENCKPLVALKNVKKGGRVYKVPAVMTPKKQFFFVVKSLTSHVWSGNKPNNEASIRFGKEILAAYNNEGAAVKAKQNLHKQAYANRAYGNLEG